MATSGQPIFIVVPARRRLMERGQPPRGLLCPGCGSGLKPLDEVAGDEHRLFCPRCRETFRARRRGASDDFSAVRPQAESPPPGSLSLFWRGLALRWLENSYRTGVIAGSAGLLALGGFVPVIQGWLRGEVKGWGGVLETLGSVHVITEPQAPDGDLGPVLSRSDAPLLFSAVDDVARR